MIDDKIRTLHPQKGQGVKILKRRYELIKKALCTILEEEGPCSQKYLQEKIKERFSQILGKKLNWYVLQVKQDLEARKIIQVIKNSKPAYYTLNKRKKRV